MYEGKDGAIEDIITGKIIIIIMRRRKRLFQSAPSYLLLCKSLTELLKVINKLISVRIITCISHLTNGAHYIALRVSGLFFGKASLT